MQKITILKDAEGHLVGEVVELKNNDAHRLIDGGFAKLFSYSDKMMTSEPRKNKRGYRVK